MKSIIFYPKTVQVFLLIHMPKTCLLQLVKKSDKIYVKLNVNREKMKVYFKDKKDLYLEVTYDDFNNYYAVKAMSFDDVLLGILNFKIIQENFYKKIWLYKIETFSEHQYKGVGSKMIIFLENFAKQNKVRYIEGRYYPENKDVVKFYKKRGYMPEIDGYEQLICKDIDQKDELDKNVIITQDIEQTSL